MPDKDTLRQLQGLPLDAKVLMTKQRIREWYNHFNGDVCVSFSGGKDSTVLAHLVHEMYPDVKLVFANTGLEYPEIQAFARKMGAEFVRPKMSFNEVISQYGYPLISKEVAEAIHFARRIVSRSAENVEITERERERVHSFAETNRAGRAERVTTNGAECSTHTHTHTQDSARRGRMAESKPYKQSAGHESQRDGERISTVRGLPTYSGNQNNLPDTDTREMAGRVRGKHQRNSLREGQKASNYRERERVQTNHAGQTGTHGERLTGTGGDEKASPG